MDQPIIMLALIDKFIKIIFMLLLIGFCIGWYAGHGMGTYQAGLQCNTSHHFRSGDHIYECKLVK